MNLIKNCPHKLRSGRLAFGSDVQSFDVNFLHIYKKRKKNGLKSVWGALLVTVGGLVCKRREQCRKKAGSEHASACKLA